MIPVYCSLLFTSKTMNKEWIRGYQIPAYYFYSEYPNASVKDVWKASKLESGLDVLLDEISR